MDSSQLYNSSSSEDMAGSMSLFDAMNSIKEFYTPVLVIMGLLSNLLVATRMCSTTFPRLHFMAYIIGLNIVDLVYLFLLFALWIQQHHLALVRAIPGWCQSVIMAGFICDTLVVWFSLGLALEAFLMLKNTVSSGMWWPAWRPRFIVVAMTVIAVSVYLNISLLYAASSGNDNRFYCLPLPCALHTIQILSQVDIAVNFVLAYVLILSTLAGTALRLWNTKWERNRNPGSIIPSQTLIQAKISILLNTVLIFTASPSNIFRLWYLTNQSNMPLETSTFMGVHQLLLQVYFSRTLLSFFVYLLTWPAFYKGFPCQRHTSSSLSSSSIICINELEENDTDIIVIDGE